jgi:hypothetical protein
MDVKPGGGAGVADAAAETGTPRTSSIADSQDAAPPPANPKPKRIRPKQVPLGTLIGQLQGVLTLKQKHVDELRSVHEQLQARATTAQTLVRNAEQLILLGELLAESGGGASAATATAAAAAATARAQSTSDSLDELQQYKQELEAEAAPPAPGTAGAPALLPLNWSPAAAAAASNGSVSSEDLRSHLKSYVQSCSPLIRCALGPAPIL